MKKFLVLIVAIFLVFSLAACGSSNSTSTKADSNTGEKPSESAKSDFPKKPIKLIIPYGPGGATDVIFRLVAKEAEKHLGQPVVPVNMEGAGATLGARHVKDAKPDGYTILGSHDTIATSHLSGSSDFSFDAFEPISLLTKTINIPSTNSKSGIKTAAEFVEYVKANPGKAKISMIPGSTSHFFMAQFLAETGISTDEIRFVGYPGTGDEVAALYANEVDFSMLNIPSGKGFYEDGSLIPAGIAHNERLDLLPDTPTLIEQGINIENATNRGIFAPKGTPEEHIVIIEEAFKKALESDEVKNKINDELGSITSFIPHTEYKDFLDKQEAKLKEIAEGLDFKK
ncbi:tripartite tricarboxylate transporter substrate binding protein [Aeromicrobium ponti]|uniref:Tripartite-type tricarboxylate transporter receptor subunit TctC n=1 Tax=Cytobacillus oceanisediminis TaxID=665099 RepID=A0A562K3L0_9BACI|nr:tripartite tricarboxylate transporter substrate binding protein [Cytobacillus oceanisediminis]TWH89833.1 tripartite-type tricarboxylate transporter receptor subunit TctC [Cytobacillus oceanisediminis]